MYNFSAEIQDKQCDIALIDQCSQILDEINANSQHFTAKSLTSVDRSYLFELEDFLVDILDNEVYLQQDLSIQLHVIMTELTEFAVKHKFLH